MDEKEKSLLQRLERTKSALARLKKKNNEAERRADTRLKIILGGVVKAAVREGALSEKGIRGLVSRFASDRDKLAFENFTFEKPEAVSAVPETAAPMPEASGDSVRE